MSKKKRKSINCIDKGRSNEEIDLKICREKRREEKSIENCNNQGKMKKLKEQKIKRMLGKWYIYIKKKVYADKSKMRRNC